MAKSPTPLANTHGFVAAKKIVQEELQKAQEEVNHAEKPSSMFAAANKDRAILRRNVLRDLLKKMT
jgi:hypothetical protein